MSLGISARGIQQPVSVVLIVMLNVFKCIFQFCLSKSLINVKGLGGKHVKTNALRLDTEFLMKRYSKEILSSSLFFLVHCTHVKALLVL